MKLSKSNIATKALIFTIFCILLISLALLAWSKMHISPTSQPHSTSSTPTPTHPAAPSWKTHAMAWIYPGPPGCNAANEYKDGRTIDTLKPQYYTLQNSGTLLQLTTETAGCNAYSPENAAEIKRYSHHQYVTVSGTTEGMDALVTSQENMDQTIATLKTFLDTVQFTGVEIDFEGFAQWTPQQYEGYKQFLIQLGNTLHQNGYTLMIDGPGFVTKDGSQYPWNYEDFNAIAVDYIVVMAYDWQYDHGVGTPVAPLAQLEDLTRTIMGKIVDKNKIVIGIPSYGYHGHKGEETMTIDTSTQSQAFPGYPTAKRDQSSAEMMFTSADTFYDYADSQTLNTKRSLIEDLGIKQISVWHLGGNSWFSGKVEPASGNR